MFTYDNNTLVFTQKTESGTVRFNFTPGTNINHARNLIGGFAWIQNFKTLSDALTHYKYAHLGNGNSEFMTLNKKVLSINFDSVMED